MLAVHSGLISKSTPWRYEAEVATPIIGIFASFWLSKTLGQFFSIKGAILIIPSTTKDDKTQKNTEKPPSSVGMRRRTLEILRALVERKLAASRVLSEPRRSIHRCGCEDLIRVLFSSFLCFSLSFMHLDLWMRG